MTFKDIQGIVGETVEILGREHVTFADGEVGARSIDEIAIQICDAKVIAHPPLDGPKDSDALWNPGE